MTFTSGPGERQLVINRVSARQWHALEDDLVVGRGDASQRPDGRVFLSIDTWHGEVFDRLADVLLAALPTPLYTIVDEADIELTCGWERVGFAARRREWEYVVPTRTPEAAVPADVTMLSLGEAEERPLRELERAIRAEVEASVGWQAMPAEVLPGPADLSSYAVAVRSGRYVGLVRISPLTRRRPRIGLIAVLAGERRRGIARTMLAHVLGVLHRKGIETASADVNAANEAAIKLFEGASAGRAGSNLELVRR